jgi:tRNA G18 (ribose-2'-O)-methylase SpoU
MKVKIRTTPDFSKSSIKHSLAIEAGNTHYSSWQHNVADHFKSSTVEEIKRSLKETSYPFAVCMENWASDFNFSSLIRNANGFNAKEVFYLGDKKYDKRGAVGTFNYTDVNFIASIYDFIRLKNDYVFVGIDNVSGSVSLPTYNWKPNSLMIFGSEGTGLTPEMLSMCKDIVSIPMMGSVRSFNAAASSAIVMYDYITKYK